MREERPTLESADVFEEVPALTPENHLALEHASTSSIGNNFSPKKNSWQRQKSVP